MHELQRSFGVVLNWCCLKVGVGVDACQHIDRGEESTTDNARCKEIDTHPQISGHHVRDVNTFFMLIHLETCVRFVPQESWPSASSRCSAPSPVLLGHLLHLQYNLATCRYSSTGPRHASHKCTYASTLHSLQERFECLISGRGCKFR